MKLIQKLTNSRLIKSDNVIPLVSILAVLGPLIVVLAGFWDAISHLQKEPEFFWSVQHVVVYTGVFITAGAAIIGSMLLLQRSIPKYTKIGIKLVSIGSIIQLISGFGDSLSHESFGIDGLISWSHQPLEFGLILASLGGVFIIKSTTHKKLRAFLPFSIISFLFFTTWLVFNLFLIFGHVIQCIPIYEIFGSGCSIL